MSIYYLRLVLQSDTTFGRGDGLAGVVDQEVEHDAEGFPFLRGRALKGLLSECCDAIVAVLPNGATDWNPALARLFGKAGGAQIAGGAWYFGDATLPADLRAAVAAQQRSDRSFTPAMVLESLTTIRRQTAIDAESGVPNDGSLRAARVIRRDLSFTCTLTVEQPNNHEVALLAAGALALRHLGAGRNRGRGRVACSLYDGDVDITRNQLQVFAGAIS